MYKIEALSDVPYAPTVAVIINCGTKWISSLALGSTLRYTPYPVLVIDCESNDGSAEHFERLARRYGWSFFWLDWPLRRHGETLDLLFEKINAASVLLVDSDLEILCSEPVRAMARELQGDERAYGSGFLQVSEWLGEVHGVSDGVGRYAERMWIPLVQLVTQPVRAALDARVSFAQQRDFVEWPSWPRLSRLAAVRFWAPRARQALDTPGFTRQELHRPATPKFIEYDTGALMHRHLRQKGYGYRAISPNLWGEVKHLHGATRSRLSSPLRRALRATGILRANNATADASAEISARSRLLEKYGVEPG